MNELARAWVYNDRSLRGQARSLMAILARTADDTYYSTETSYGALARLLNAPRRSVVRTMKRLQASGHIRLIRRTRSRVPEGDKYLPGLTPPPTTEHVESLVLLSLGRDTAALDRIAAHLQRRDELPTYPQKSHHPKRRRGGDSRTPGGDPGTPPVVTPGHQGVVTPGHHPLQTQNGLIIRESMKTGLSIHSLRREIAEGGSVDLVASDGIPWRAVLPVPAQRQGIILRHLTSGASRTIYLDADLAGMTIHQKRRAT